MPVYRLLLLLSLMVPMALSAHQPVWAQSEGAPVDEAVYMQPADDYSLPRTSILSRITRLAGACGCCLFWCVIMGSVVISFSRYSWWGRWLWQVTVVRRAGDWMGSLWARLASRKRMEQQMRARTANPRDSKARYNLGVIWMERRKWDLAADELAASVEINPDRADAQYRLAKCLAELGRRDEAIEAAEQCVQQRPEHYDALLLMGQCLLEANRTDEARQTFDQFLAPRRDDVPGWFWRGRVEEQAGAPEAAVQWYTGAIERARNAHGPNRARDRSILRDASRRVSALNSEMQAGE